MPGDPLAPRNKTLPIYSTDTYGFASPLKRWSSEAQDWVSVEIAKTPVQEARIRRRKIEEHADRMAALASSQLVEEEPPREVPTQHLRPRSPWWRHWILGGD